MAWTLTTVAGRVGRSLGRTFPERGDAVSSASTFHTLYSARADAVLASLAPADLRAAEADIQIIGRGVAQRILASGHSISSLSAVAAMWDELPEWQRRVVEDPCAGPEVSVGLLPATQIDETTCGPTAAVMAALIADPVLALWLAVSDLPSGVLPYLGLSARAAGMPDHTVRDRWVTLQRVVHVQSTGLGAGLPWPRRLGTPPWGLAATLRVAGLRFRSHLLDDSHVPTMESFVARASRLVRGGIPVPIYSGGDSRGGLGQAVPRHVVLLVGRYEADAETGFEVFEPSAGRVRRLADSRIVWGVASAPDGSPDRHPALGYWNRLNWAVLPR